jgi:hypothetical protein
MARKYILVCGASFMPFCSVSPLGLCATRMSDPALDLSSSDARAHLLLQVVSSRA